MTNVSRMQVYVCLRVLRRSFLLLTTALLILAAAADAMAQGRRARVSEDLAQQLSRGDVAATRVIITGTQAEVDRLAESHALTVLKRLKTGAVVEVPAGALAALADDADQLSSDFQVRSQMSLTTETTGASQVWEDDWIPGLQGRTGHGVGVAVIDSGVDVLPELRGRVVASVDFTDDRGRGLDEYGHGTHVAGIIAAGGRNRHDDTRGMAPGAHIVSLKVLGADGSGRAAEVVQAIDWAIEQQARFNIQVINLSLGAPVMQSWRDDPVCQAVERAVRAGITVVASAGNLGETTDGRLVYGAITSPGNSPFALTAGASSTKSTVSRSDDQPARRSSKGPTRFDRLIKPDILAPGTRINGLLARGASLAAAHPELVVNTGSGARLQLSGTSMSAGVVSGAVALLTERAELTPLQVRIALQYTARRTDASLLAAGAGYLNVPAALAMPNPDLAPLIAGEAEVAARFAFTHAAVRAARDVAWGEGASEVHGENDHIIWSEADHIVWSEADHIIWSEADHIIWSEADHIIWSEADHIIWSEADHIIWSEADHIIWSEADHIIWSEADHIIWSE